MSIKIILVLLTLILLSGCQILENLQTVDPSQNRGVYVPDRYKNNTNTTSDTNTTNTTNEFSTINKTHYYIYPNTVLVEQKGESFLIDSGDYKALQKAKEKDMNPMGMIITLDSPDKINKAKYFILGTTPEIVYDNGFNSTARQSYYKYFQYQDRLNMTLEVVNRDTVIIGDHLLVEFFTPFFEYGLDPIYKDYNSIPVQVNDLLYMSNCYEKCEKQIDTTAKHLVLASNGNCPTNSVEFLLDTAVEDIYGETYCKQMLYNAELDNLTDLNYFGIEFHKVTDEEVVIE